jgi:hypothetical protein
MQIIVMIIIIIIIIITITVTIIQKKNKRYAEHSFDTNMHTSFNLSMVCRKKLS